MADAKGCPFRHSGDNPARPPPPGFGGSGPPSCRCGHLRRPGPGHRRTVRPVSSVSASRASTRLAPDPLLAGRAGPLGPHSVRSLRRLAGGRAPSDPKRQRRVMSPGRAVWVKVRASEAERAEWHTKARSARFTLSDLVRRSATGTAAVSRELPLLAERGPRHGPSDQTMVRVRHPRGGGGASTV